MLNHTEAEEATLEHTPPLTSIYTPPSIKTLFQQHQCKSSFRKFTTKSIKTYTSKYNRNTIHNLSDHTITDEEFSFLRKGLSFVPTLRSTFQHQMNISWNRFKTRMLIQYFFRNSVHDKPHPFKTKSHWILPPSDNPTLVNLGRKTYINLTIQEKKALTISKITNLLSSNHVIKVEAFA